MASLSCGKSCLHCDDSSSDSLKNGWDLSTGKFAQLCGRCYSIYESGRFCETFHRRQHDWRKCQSCSKPVICSCLVSFSEWFSLEGGVHKIICNECSKITSFLPVHCSCLVSFSEWFSLEGGVHKIICNECSKITSFLARNFSTVLDLDDEIRRFQICRISKSEIVPLFEKLLHAGDIDNSDGSIVIPRKYAEAYLPEVSDPLGISLNAFDETDIKKWNLRFRFWLNKMYVLDDLREYMASNKLKGGDTLTFSRLVPNGPYVLGFRKASTKKPSSLKASTRDKQ